MEEMESDERKQRQELKEVAKECLEIGKQIGIFLERGVKTPEYLKEQLDEIEVKIDEIEERYGRKI